MPYKFLTVVLTDTDTAPFLCDAAATLADRWGAHLDVLCIGLHPVDPYVYGMGAVPSLEQFSKGEAEDRARELKKVAEPMLVRADVTFEIRELTSFPSTVAHAVTTQIRFSDVVLLPRPEDAQQPHIAVKILEAAIFDARLPVIVLPKGVEVGDIAARVLIGWNESDAALAAVRGAMPLLADGGQVEVALIDPPRETAEGFDPGNLLASALAHHGAKVELAEIALTMPRISDMLLQRARDMAATVLVFGAYSHSRMRQSLLGGTTREILENAKLPLFIAH